MIIEKAIERVNENFSDDIDNIALLVERMQEINKVVFDASCHTCRNNTTDPLITNNNYYLIENQSRILIMTILLGECIEELEKIQSRMGENYSNFMECIDVQKKTN